MKSPLKTRLKAKKVGKKSALKDKFKKLLGLFKPKSEHAIFLFWLCLTFILLGINCGCTTADPSSRSTSVEYGDIRVSVIGSQGCTISVTIGDGALSSSDLRGESEENFKAEQSPKIDVPVSIPIAG